MIIDNIRNARLYSGMGEGFAKAFQYLRETDFANMETGRHEVDGSGMYAMVQRYDSKPGTDGAWESHRKYIDIQYIAEGAEKIGYSDFKRITLTQEYCEEKDSAHYEGEGDFLTLEKGMFIALFPEDAHMPYRAIAEPRPVVKVVVKVPAGRAD